MRTKAKQILPFVAMKGFALALRSCYRRIAGLFIRMNNVGKATLAVSASLPISAAA
jgi:hypothetical protein